MDSDEAIDDDFGGSLHDSFLFFSLLVLHNEVDVINILKYSFFFGVELISDVEDDSLEFEKPTP